ncbi:MAG TPA: agmatine deiminase family protein [Polyangiaceae bacterium]|nr:agmatine deiminase family protein [Polyangiaceae bacterium]
MSTLVVPALVASGVACAAAGPTAPDRPSPGVRIGRTEILAARPPPRGLPLEEGYPIAVIDPRPLTRVLRGDFEPPDTLVLAYEEDWLESIRQIVAAAAGQTRVLLLSAGQQARADAFRQLIADPHVDAFPGAFDSPWVRDYGPLQTYELTSGPLWLDFGYAWNRPQDDRLPSVLSSRMHARVENPGFDLDGGAVISNGQGLCALTRTSLLDAGFADPDSEELEVFLGSLGCHATAILPAIPGEPTGHVDVIAQFLATDLAMVAWLDPNENGELGRALDAVAEHLLTTATLADYPLEIVRIPLQTSGETFFSYVNATRLRTRLLVPRFNEVPEELERHAYSLLALALPEAAIVPIDADVMVRLGGAVHCVTLGLGPTAASPPPVERARAEPRAPLTGRSG